MKDLLLALAIFNKYIPNEEYPFNCEHDELSVNCSPSVVSEEDKETLYELGFFSAGECFQSYKFGSF